MKLLKPQGNYKGVLYFYASFREGRECMLRYHSTDGTGFYHIYN